MWEHLLPAMEADALAPSPADDELAQRMAHLSLPDRGGAARVVTIWGMCRR